MRNNQTLAYFVPHIIRTAKTLGRRLGKREFLSAILVHQTNRKLIYFDFAVSRIFPPFANLESFNAKITITGLPFQSSLHKGTLKVQVNVYDVTFPRSCQIIVESVTCNLGNPTTVNPNTILHNLEADWLKGCP